LQRATAAAVLSRARLDDHELLELIDTIRTANPLELPRLLGAFERSTSEETGLKLITALRRSKSLQSLRPEQLKPVLAKHPAAVQQAGDTLLAELNVDAGKQKARLDELEKSLPVGHRDRGRRLFESSKTACATCHQVGYLGGKIGPDLSRIGSIRTERDLLESIVYPSASFVRSYEAMIVSTRDGEEHSGVLREESGNNITLITGASSEMRLARTDIKEIRPGTLSIMPQGMDEQLSQEEMADLVVFLKSLK
jgi:putative heme-binding domain-containing protein